MANILLIEPDYNNKYPPLGLMKIAYFHKHIMHDYVRFTKGKLPEAMSGMHWDHVYVTSLFTFEWAKTIEAIEYAKTLVTNITDVTVGGIAATMMPEQFYEATGIMPVRGLLNEPGKLGLPGDECIDQMVPDYSILDQISYKYPARDAYFLSATKGCGNKCGFCAVQTLEPKYIPYIDIKEKIAAIDREFGPKKDLLLMDNNVLRSAQFDKIIDDIIEVGFGKGATYINPKTGKRVRRYVDFNQGLDAMFLNERKAARLGEIALRPARIAFDHIEDLPTYERALRLCAKNGITQLSNYVLYNSEDFGGKGQKYAADTPADLYNRMRITLDIRDDVNRGLPADQHVSAFSFPMRYIPLSAHERGYIGSKWNAKFLRSVQCMLIPTQGKGVGSRSFFEADFGRDADEFVRYLCMPERLIAARGNFVEGGRGRTAETAEQLRLRRSVWEKNRRKIAEWNRLYDLLGNEKDSFIKAISDNEFFPEKVLNIASDIQKQLYLHYLTTPRMLSLLGLINPDSSTYHLIKDYLTVTCPDLYREMLEMVIDRSSQQKYVFRNFVKFFGKSGMDDILSAMSRIDFKADKLLQKWASICKEDGIGYVDFSLIRVYTRFVEMQALNGQIHQEVRAAILGMDMSKLALILNENLAVFEKAVLKEIEDEQGQALLKACSDAIFNNIQLKLSLTLGETNE